MQGQRGPIGFPGPHGDKGDRVRLTTSSSEADREKSEKPEECLQSNILESDQCMK